MAYTRGAPNWFADGTIEPCRFVSPSLTAGEVFGVIQATADAVVVGIAQEGSHDTPGLTGSLDDAARDGHPITVHTLGELALLEVGGVVTQGDYLRPDANGKGAVFAGGDIAATFVGAIALEDATADGQKIRVLVVLAPARRA